MDILNGLADKIEGFKKISNAGIPVYIVMNYNNTHKELEDHVVLLSKKYLRIVKLTLDGFITNSNGVFMTFKEINYFATGYCLDVENDSWFDNLEDAVKVLTEEK